MPQINRPAQPVTANGIKILTDRVRQHLSNASINLPEYSDPEFRLDQVKDAIHLLKCLQMRLETDVAIKKARSVENGV